MRTIKNIISTIIYILMFLVFSITVYFCLDIFGIIEVPAQYSIVEFFNYKIEVIATGQNIEDVGTIDNLNNIDIASTTNTIAEGYNEKQNANDGTELIERIKYISNELNKRNVSYEVDLDSVNSNKFYYSQLDEYAKIIYDELYRNKENMKSGNYTINYGRTFNELLNTENGTKTLNNDFQLAINALSFDNPEFFYIDITKIYLLTEITTRAFSKTYNVSIGANNGNYLVEEFEDPQVLEEAISSVERIKNEVINDSDGSTYDKIKNVHDYLVDNVEYDGENPWSAYNIYGSLVDNRCVCEGYAKSFKYILDDMGIPCIVVCGIGRNSEDKTESHAWNYVYIDDAWYAVDVTWDDPVITGGGRITNAIKYAYFLKGSESFSTDHFEDGNIVADANFEYPAISRVDF